AVNVLFLLYNGVDTFYLWIHKTLPAGINYSSYARSGTFWLTVALALTSLVLGIIFLRGLNFHKRTPILKVFSWIWVAQNLILAMGTFRRLQMYIDYNGLTRTRIVGAYGILVVIAGLLIVAFKMRDAKSFLWMVRRHALAFVLTLFALAMTPMDFFVFRYNTRIILSGNPRSAVQMVVQPITAEGIPSLIPLLNSPNKEIREGVAGILLREKHRLLQQQRQGKRWVDGELASSRALRMIAAVQHRLDEIIPDGQWPGPVDKLYKNTRQWYD
ncbi:MAG: DUF4173 domain-containing protein, partial [Planctomycetes bacterium]|nr:DUF4173 domain-containing protein [Planctomycetota bacterium]